MRVGPDGLAIPIRIGDLVGDTPPLPVSQVAMLETTAGRQSQAWLVEHLWGAEAVGLIAGPPKACKTWLALDMAIGVASGTPVLGRFAVQEPGAVLVYFAEDALPALYRRVAGICAQRDVDPKHLDMHVVTAPALRLDVDIDQARLTHALEQVQPRLLLLDPLVRLHRLNENSAADISGLLAYLREQQRRFHCAIALVHHMTKRVGAHLGKALRGSGDLYAWVDSAAYLTRGRRHLRLAVEHRSASAIEPLNLELVDHPRGACLAVVEPDVADAHRPAPTPRDLHAAILAALAEPDTHLTRRRLRDLLRVNNQRLGEALQNLEAQGQITRSPGGWRLGTNEQPTLF